jgi:hypothetical protein
VFSFRPRTPLPATSMMAATDPQLPAAAIDLRPPMILREIIFPLSRKPWKELQRHAQSFVLFQLLILSCSNRLSSGIHLPTTLEEYKEQLLLDSAALDQVSDCPPLRVMLVLIYGSLNPKYPSYWRLTAVFGRNVCTSRTTFSPPVLPSPVPSTIIPQRSR